MLVLFIGDFFIPSRSIDLPLQFKKLLVPNKISMIYCTGNLSPQTLTYLSTISQLVTTRGSTDANYRDQHKFTLKGFEIGIYNELLMDDVLLKEQIARKMDVDILVTGGTMKFEAYERNKRFYISPGSCTGAFNLQVEDTIPSFVLMDVNQNSFSLYVYKLINDQVKVEKIDYKK
jgi:vacuolar protein sorting-associated protein 29